MTNFRGILAASVLLLTLSACRSSGSASTAAPGVGTAIGAASSRGTSIGAPPTVVLPASPLPPTQAAIMLPPETFNPAASPTFTLSPTLPATSTAAPPARADRLPDPAGYAWQPVAAGLRSPVGITHAGDGSGRLFVLEQAGDIRIIKDSVLQPHPFLDISAEVTNAGNEQGLLGLAFHPRYAENGYFYVNYTNTRGDTVISRFQVSAQNPDAADVASEKRLLLVDQPYQNHNGGAVIFGPDGYLYLGLGDGGSAGDPHGNGQSLNTLLGKILRIDVDHGDPYAIPPDNPFAAGGGKPEIWAYGLRNPWRIAFDPQTADLYIGDVGQNQWEEVDWLPAGAPGGANFGWNIFEGSHPYQGTLPAGTTVIAPVAEYSHAEGGCSVTGGEVYRGKQLPVWQGVYLYGDFCSGIVWGLLRRSDGSWENKLLFQNAGQITSFGEDETGEIYLLDRAGVVYKLTGK